MPVEFDWIRSTEIREYLRRNFKPDIRERLFLIRSAYRPMEERLEAMRALLPEARNRREKRAVQQEIVCFERFLQMIYEARTGQFYIVYELIPGESLSMGSRRGRVYASFAELYRAWEEEPCPVGRVGYDVEKWELAEGRPRWLLSVTLAVVDGRLSIVDFLPTMDDWERDRWAEAQGICVQGCWRGDRDRENRFRLPFETGDLICADAPMFERPQYGVMCNGQDLNGTVYVMMGWGRHDRGELIGDVLELACPEIDLNSGYRVIDWLRRAEASELRKEETALEAVSRYLSHLHCLDRAAAVDELFRIFAGEDRMALCRFYEGPIHRQSLRKNDDTENG